MHWASGIPSCIDTGHRGCAPGIDLDERTGRSVFQNTAQILGNRADRLGLRYREYSGDFNEPFIRQLYGIQIRSISDKRNDRSTFDHDAALARLRTY